MKLPDRLLHQLPHAKQQASKEYTGDLLKKNDPKV